TLAWSADGRLLAAGCLDNCAYVLDSASGERLSTLRGHQLRVTMVGFNHASDLLATTSWDDNIRFWDPLRGIPLLTFPGASSYQMQFSQDDRLLAAFSDLTRFGFLEVAASPIYRRFRTSDRHGHVHSLDVSADGRLLIAGGAERLCFLDLAT